MIPEAPLRNRCLEMRRESMQKGRVRKVGVRPWSSSIPARRGPERTISLRVTLIHAAPGRRVLSNRIDRSTSVSRK